MYNAVGRCLFHIGGYRLNVFGVELVLVCVALESRALTLTVQLKENIIVFVLLLFTTHSWF